MVFIKCENEIEENAVYCSKCEKINKLENLEKLWLFVYSWGEIFEKVIRFIKLKKDCKKMENKV